MPGRATPIFSIDDDSGALRTIVERINELSQDGFNKKDLIETVISEFQGSVEFQKLADLFVTEAINNIVTRTLHKRRSDAARAARNRDFVQATVAYANGDTTAMATWMETSYKTQQGVYIKLADMAKVDCVYVANSYRSMQNAAMLKRAFFEAIANQLNENDRVSDRYDAEKLDRLWNSLQQL